jgi:ATP-dependent Clp protease protease subunit
MKKNKLPSPPKFKNIVGGKANVDTKLSQAALLLEYSFGFKVDFKNRIIVICGDIDSSVFEIVEAAMTEMESQSRKTITFKINSGGGEVYQALAIVGRMRNSKCKILTEGYGHMMSAATMILAAGDERSASKYSFFMHHESSYMVDGKHSEIQNEVANAEREEDFWAQWMEEFTKQPKKYWKKTGVGTNAYFSADKLVDLGVIDYVF